VNQARNALRGSLRERRRSLPAPERIAAAGHLATRLLALPFAPSSGAVAGYWAMDGEIALLSWQLQLPREVTYCLPVLAGDGLLRFAPWRPGEPLAGNRFGIPEPDVGEDALIAASELALVVMPLVGFDASGNRLGMGGGWYDRTFAFRNDDAAGPPPWLVGAGFGFQQLDTIEREPWDVPLDATCTEADTFLTGAA
jgi:5-formyltetrahydrofolate cyclo-ligase